MGPLFPGSGLHALRRGWLHSPKIVGLHSHSLGGCSGGKQQRRQWISGLRRGGSVLERLSLGKIYFNRLRMWRMENPKGFGFYL
jgi:hypothetical protein